MTIDRWRMRIAFIVFVVSCLIVLLAGLRPETARSYPLPCASPFGFSSNGLCFSNDGSLNAQLDTPDIMQFAFFSDPYYRAADGSIIINVGNLPTPAPLPMFGGSSPIVVATLPGFVTVSCPTCVTSTPTPAPTDQPLPVFGVGAGPLTIATPAGFVTYDCPTCVTAVLAGLNIAISGSATSPIVSCPACITSMPTPAPTDRPYTFSAAVPLVLATIGDSVAYSCPSCVTSTPTPAPTDQPLPLFAATSPLTVATPAGFVTYACPTCGASTLLSITATLPIVVSAGPTPVVSCPTCITATPTPAPTGVSSIVAGSNIVVTGGAPTPSVAVTDAPVFVGPVTAARLIISTFSITVLGATTNIIPASATQPINISNAANSKNNLRVNDVGDLEVAPLINSLQTLARVPPYYTNAGASFGASFHGVAGMLSTTFSGNCGPSALCVLAGGGGVLFTNAAVFSSTSSYSCTVGANPSAGAGASVVGYNPTTAAAITLYAFNSSTGTIASGTAIGIAYNCVGT